VQGIHAEVAEAAGKVDDRMTSAQDDQQKRSVKQDEAKQAYENWAASFVASHGHEPSKEERWAQVLNHDWLVVGCSECHYSFLVYF